MLFNRNLLGYHVYELYELFAPHKGESKIHARSKFGRKNRFVFKKSAKFIQSAQYSIMYGIAYRVNGFTALLANSHSFVEISHGCFAYMWHNLFYTVLNFLRESAVGCGLVGINTRLQNPPKNKVQRH